MIMLILSKVSQVIKKMEYKTVIEIITEANDSHDAADIAGEYLRGTLDAGVKMSAVTKRVRRFKSVRIAIFSLILLFALSATTYRINKHKPAVFNPTRNISAVQPPLKTNSFDKQLKGRRELFPLE